MYKSECYECRKLNNITYNNQSYKATYDPILKRCTLCTINENSCEYRKITIIRA